MSESKIEGIETRKTKDNFDSIALTEDFLDFEKDQKLFSIEVKGYKFWDYIRYHVYEKIIDYHQSFNSLLQCPSENYIKRLGKVKNIVFSIMPFVLSKIKYKKKNYDIIFINTSIKRFTFNKKNVDYYTFPVIQKLYNRYKILLIDPQEFIDRDIKRNYPCDVLALRFFNLIDRVKSFFVFYNNRDKNIFFDIQKMIKRRFAADIDIYKLTREVFSYHIQRKKRFYKIFKDYKPKLLIYADNGFLKSIIQAGHEYGAKTIDLQHSLVSFLNVLYNYPERAKKNGLATISDYIFTFGDCWNQEFRLPANKVSMGFPFFEIKKEKYCSKIDLHKQDKSKNIIIISVIRSKQSLIRIAVKLANLLPEYKIFYKLRLREYGNWRQQYPQSFIENPNITVIDNNQISLYDYFRISDYQIGTNTTALYEGLFFGLTTFVLKSGWYQEMRTLYENDYAFLVSEADEIAAKIKNHHKPKQKINSEYIFKRNSLSNIRKAISDIIGG